MALLGALWHALWIDNQVGLDLLTEILPVLAVADPVTAQSASDMSDRFASTLTSDQRHDLDLLTVRADAQPFDLPASRRLDNALDRWLLLANTRNWWVNSNLLERLTDYPEPATLYIQSHGRPPYSFMRTWTTNWLAAYQPNLLMLDPSANSLLASLAPRINAIRRVSLTQAGLALMPPGMGTNDALVGEWADRKLQ